jgi:glycosyltransferase involved in cell wall biosynthesis
LIKNERRGGAAFSRNVGINNSTGDLIAFLDCDDLWHPTKLMSQVEALSVLAIAMCYTDYELIDHTGCVLKTFKQPLDFAPVNIFSAGSESFVALGQVHIATTSLVMVRRSALLDCGVFDPSLSCCEDFDLWLRLCSKYKSVFLNSAEASYRTHSAQNTRTEYYISSQDDERVWSKYVALAQKTKNPDLAQTVQLLRSRTRLSYSALAYDNARTAYRKGDFPVMLKFLSRAFLLDPKFAAEQMGLWLNNNVSGRAHTK